MASDVIARPESGFTLESDGFHLKKTWSHEEFATLSAEIARRKSFGYYHKIVITDASGKTLTTPGSHDAAGVIAKFDKMGFPKDLRGKTVLDIGCNAGFYSIVCWLRGATRVFGPDFQLHYIEQAKLIRQILGIPETEIEFSVGDGYTISADSEKFDFVVNTGVVYHLQNPMDFLRKVAAVTRQAMFLESEMLTDPAVTDYAWFIEQAYGGDTSNWWIYGPKCMERMVRAAGFTKAEFLGFVWKPLPGTLTEEGFKRQGRGAFLCRK